MRLALPRGLSARIIGLTLLALIVAQIVGYVSYRYEQDALLQRVVIDYFSESIPAIEHMLGHVRAGENQAAVRSLSNHFADYDLVPQGLRCPRKAAAKPRLARQLATKLHVPRGLVNVCIGRDLLRGRPEQRALALSVPRSAGQWLVIRSPVPHREAGWAWRTLRNLLITLLIMSGAVILVSRALTRPLRALAGAAERFGRGERITPVAEGGSDEIRRTIVEFNRMHERIDRFIAERTRLVAALAHDLRTPITALRLRLEFLPDDDNTAAMHATLNDMAEMSEATLTFMRSETTREATRPVDLAALIDAVVEDYRAARAAVAFAPSARVTLACRPTAIRRALRNIIDNALAYGQRADLALAIGAEVVAITIADRGPGIAAADREAVFDAFVRLEASRSRETGGAGLGLSIARSVIRGHGGDIELGDRPGGGLVVTLRLPRAQPLPRVEPPPQHLGERRDDSI